MFRKSTRVWVTVRPPPRVSGAVARMVATPNVGVAGVCAAAETAAVKATAAVKRARRLRSNDLLHIRRMSLRLNRETRVRKAWSGRAVLRDPDLIRKLFAPLPLPE